jgi:UDP-N-acetylglucosamine 1-carboxyvinyltransferase
MHNCLRIVGGTPLRGDVTLNGSKNGALPILAASLLVQGTVVLRNVPQISDVDKMCQLMRLLGASVAQEGDTVTIDATHLTSARADRDLSAAMRASHYVLAPLLARFGHAEVPLPGGCAIGDRPVDYILNALRQLDIPVEERIDVMVGTLAGGLHGGTVTLNPTYRSPGATYDVAMAAVLAEGQTVIENASPDPEVENFCRFLQAAGAIIERPAADRIVIDGVKTLHGCEHTVLSDRIEAGTYLMAGAATQGDVRVSPIKPEYLEEVLAKLEEMGLQVLREKEAVTVRWVGRPKGSTVFTRPYPAFPTDLQSPMVVLMCLAEGRSTMAETIYDGRLTYVHELRRMGARVKLVSGKEASIEGVERLQGRDMEGSDMRASAALVIAALAADGESHVAGNRYIARGYQGFIEKLQHLGAQVAECPGVDDGAEG